MQTPQEFYGVWLTRKEAAEWIGRCGATVSSYVKKMEAEGYDGVFRSDDGILQYVNKGTLNDWMANKGKGRIHYDHY